MRLLILALVLLAVPVQVLAQRRIDPRDAAMAGRDRVAPGAIPAEVGTLTDTAALGLLERRNSRSRDLDALMTAGFAALRLWEVTGDRTHAKRARRYFDRVTSSDPTRAHAHYGYALGLVGDIETEPEPGEIVLESNAMIFFGIDALSRSRRALERAVRLDPTLPGAVELLARYARDTRHRPALQQARDALTHAGGQPAASAPTLLELSATARELGDYEAAAEAADRVPADDTAHLAQAAYARAHALALLGGADEQVGASYMHAVSLMADADRDILLQDLMPLLGEADIRRLDSMDTAQQRAWLQRFWINRAALAGVSEGERIAEHFRRMHEARERYPRRGRYGAPSMNALVLKQISPSFDDRGAIYVRHGEPARIITSAPEPGRPEEERGYQQESWLYFREDARPVMYHFEKVPGGMGGGSLDFNLMNTLRCSENFVLARIEWDRRLAPLLRGCSAMTLATASVGIRRDALRALRTDSHRPAFTEALPFHYDIYTFRGPGERTDVVAAISFAPTSSDTVALRFSVSDTASATVARTEKLAVVPAAARDAGHVRTHLAVWALPVTHGLYRIAAVDRDDSTRGQMYGGPLEVRSYTGDTLMVSDVMLAEPTEDGAFERGGQRLALAPSQVFRDGELRVFYEIYNLRPGETFRTEIEVEPRGEGVRAAVRRIFGRDQPVRLIFEGTVPPTATATLQESRLVTAPFPPGDYSLSVTITIADAERAVKRDRRFTIEPRQD